MDTSVIVYSTQLNYHSKKEWFNKRKEAKANIYPQYFNRQSRSFLKVATVSQLINDSVVGTVLYVYGGMALNITVADK